MEPFTWQPEKDSNPHKQSQSLPCYRYTIRLCMLVIADATIIIAKDGDLSTGISSLTKKAASGKINEKNRSKKAMKGTRHGGCGQRAGGRCEPARQFLESIPKRMAEVK